MKKLIYFFLLISSLAYGDSSDCISEKEGSLKSVHNIAQDINSVVEKIKDSYYIVHFQGNDNSELKVLQDSKDNVKINEIKSIYENLVQKKLTESGCKNVSLKKSSFEADALYINIVSTNCRAQDVSSGIASCQKNEKEIKVMDSFADKTYWIEEGFCIKI